MALRKIDLNRVYSVMDREHLDALVAATPENVFYLSDLPTSFTSGNRLLYAVRNASPSFCVVPRNSDPELILTSSALELAEKHSWITHLRPYATGTYIVRHKQVSELGKDGFVALSSTFKELNGIKKVGIEKQNTPHKFMDQLTRAVGASDIVDASPIFDELRMIKTAEEVRRFKEANRILCKAIRNVIKKMKPGVSERELVFALKMSILKEDGESWQQTTIARGPENGPNIFNQPTESKIAKGDIIRLDIGCVYQGYTADLSRTVTVGKPSPEAAKIYGVLQDAEDEMIENSEIGVKVSKLHSIAVQYVKDKLDPAYRRGNVGHGVGVELYDRPVISEDDDTPLAPGMTLSVEVPYHKFGVGGFNIEDSMLVTEKRCEILSDLPRELIRA